VASGAGALNLDGAYAPDAGTARRPRFRQRQNWFSAPAPLATSNVLPRCASTASTKVIRITGRAKAEASEGCDDNEKFTSGLDKRPVIG